MKNFLITVFLGGFLFALTAHAGEAATLQAAEIVDILKTNYVDREKLDDKTLDAATLTGILKVLGRGVQILTEVPTNRVADVNTNNSALARAEVIFPDIGYIRIGDLEPATVRALDEELKKFSEEKVTGYILDLRFADGTNYEAAAKVASRFIEGEEPLFTLKRATGESSTFHTMPLVQRPAEGLSGAPIILLVNEHTCGSAEALAGALRLQDRGIIIGNPTTGNPVAMETIKLNDGRWLRVVTEKIVMPDGSSPFPDGLAPDVLVKIANTVERDAVLAATNITLTASLQPKQKKKAFSEAELVKAFRGEAFSTGPISLSEEEPEAAVTNQTESAEIEAEPKDVRDTVLERAVDILKGIRVFSSVM